MQVGQAMPAIYLNFKMFTKHRLKANNIFAIFVSFNLRSSASICGLSSFPSLSSV